MKKNILFTAYTLDVGGIETALVTLLNELSKKYHITLVLEKKQGVFIDQINDKINIIEYSPNQDKNILKRKTINLLKRIKFIKKHKNKYDFAASFATYSIMGAFCARMASKNNALWAHAKYSKIYENKNEMRKFFKTLKYKKFSNIIFVSKEGAEDFKNVFPDKAKDVLVCNNLIDYEKILNESNKTINYNKKKDTFTFINISRHEENQKRLSRIIEASKILRNEEINFKVLMIGNGPDNNKYKKMVRENRLEDYIEFLGELKNPYPYLKIGDALIMTSEYEGYPVVFVESMVLGIPIITTNISDSKEEIDNKYGIVVNKSTPEEIANGMKKMIAYKDKYKTKFDAKQYNNVIINKLESIIDGGNNAKN